MRGNCEAFAYSGTRYRPRCMINTLTFSESNSASINRPFINPVDDITCKRHIIRFKIQRGLLTSLNNDFTKIKNN